MRFPPDIMLPIAPPNPDHLSPFLNSSFLPARGPHFISIITLLTQEDKTRRRISLMSNCFDSIQVIIENISLMSNCFDSMLLPFVLEKVTRLLIVSLHGLLVVFAIEYSVIIVLLGSRMLSFRTFVRLNLIPPFLFKTKLCILD